LLPRTKKFRKITKKISEKTKLSQSSAYLFTNKSDVDCFREMVGI